jgi:RNA polymerase sigma-70 factor (ECF subfamily)
LSLLAAALSGHRPVNDDALEVSLQANSAKLVAAARSGDRAAFGRLYDLYASMVHGILLARVPHDDVDDLVQEVFMTALRSLSTLRDASSFGAWLAAIARNRANDYHRHAAPEDQLTDDPEETERANSSENPERPAAEILDLVRSLPDAYRETLILRLVEGMTGPEIAARTGLTHGSVRVNLHRGMQLLREKLGRPSAPEQETKS